VVVPVHARKIIKPKVLESILDQAGLNADDLREHLQGATTRKREYTVVLIPEPEEGGYSVIVPALTGCVTQGETMEEAIAMAQDAIAGWIMVAQKHGEEVPEETQHPISVTIKVEA